MKKSHHIQCGPGGDGGIVPVYCGESLVHISETVSRHGDLYGMKLCRECEVEMDRHWDDPSRPWLCGEDAREG